MVAACMISGEFTGFEGTERVIAVLKKYGLPTLATFEPKEVMNVLRMDKKRVKDSMNYILLSKIGQAAVREIPIAQLEKLLQSIITAR
jgi:3-dehydroquinate synthetase